MGFKVTVLMTIAVGGIMKWLGEAPLVLPDFVLVGVPLLIVAGASFMLAYLLYWSLPYSRKHSGIAAVDAAIERYRKPGEQVGGAWVAPVVIADKRYRMVVYRNRDGSRYGYRDEPLAFDENGVVVRDLGLMNKVVQGNRLAWNVSFPEQINARTEAYKELGRFPVLLARALKKMTEWQAILGPRRKDDLRAVGAALVSIGEYMRQLREAHYREAEWGMLHGNTKLKEVAFEEVARLNAELKPHAVFYDRFDVMKRGVEAAMRISQALKRDWALARQVKGLGYVLYLLTEARERVEKAEEHRKAGTQETYYDGLSAKEVGDWRARLAWVEVVDSLMAQGYTGEALEAKKREYLAEQARLEAERKRQEEAERTRQREEQAQKRAARKAQRKQKERKESEG